MNVIPDPQDYEIATDIASIFTRLDASSTDALLKSIAKEFALLYEEQNRRVIEALSVAAIVGLGQQIEAGELPEMGGDYPDDMMIDGEWDFRKREGFYGVEYDEKLQPYRWNGPGPKFCFELFVNRKTPAGFVLSFDRYFEAGPEGPLICFADGVRSPLRFEAREKAHIAIGSLPVRSDNGGTLLTFICRRTGMVEDRPQRPVGIRFRGLSIGRAPG